MPTRQRKRPRKTPADNKDEGRPAPPPPAPPSLIKLLKKDKKVLEYFRSLQENLSYDEKKWKKRAHAYKEELEELKRAKAQTQSTEQNERTETWKQSERDGGVSKPPDPKKTDLGATNNATVIGDDAFDFELSSSSDEDGHGHGGGRDNGDDPTPLRSSTALAKQTSNKSYKFNVDNDEEEDEDEVNDGVHTTTVQTGSEAPRASSEKKKLVPNYIRVGWKFLRKAEEYLNEIGVVLANKIEITERIDEIKDGDGSNGNSTNDENDAGEVSFGNGDNNAEEGEELRTYTSYIRRSDNVVLADILETIREWTKLKITVHFPLLEDSGILDKNNSQSENANEELTNEREKTLKHRYAAFESSKAIPCFVPLPRNLFGDGVPRHDADRNISEGLKSPHVPQHPSVRGVEILLKALAWIDAFGSILDEIEIDNYSKSNCSEIDEFGTDDIGSYFMQLVESENPESNGEADSSMTPSKSALSPAMLFVTGMKKRHIMVRKFVKSLEGEICDTWPVHDRFDRFRNQALHDNRNHSSDNNINNDNQRETPKSTQQTIAMERKVVLDAKNTARLATMVERCILARIVTGIYLHRNDPSRALDFFFSYISTTAPSLKLESYPKYPSVQSLLIIEAILDTPFNVNMDDVSENQNHRTLFDFLLDINLTTDLASNSNDMVKNKDFNLLFEAFQLVIAASAVISRFRVSHEDTRISEPGFVEGSAYQRIASRLKRSRILVLDIEAMVEENNSPDLLFISINKRCARLIQQFSNDTVITERATQLVPLIFTWMLPITIVVQGDSQTLRNNFLERSEVFLSSKSERELILLEGYAKALRQMEIRSIDSYRAVINSPTTNAVKSPSQSVITRLINSIIDTTENEYGREDVIGLCSLSILMKICHELADGESALRLIQWWLKCRKISEENTNSNFERQVSSFLNYWSTFSTVRVINLERRKDRMAAFLSQTMHAGLWAIRGVIPPDRWEAMKRQHSGRKELLCKDEDGILTSHIGLFAIDGSQGSPAQVELKLMKWLELGGYTNGSVSRELNLLVKPQWRPNDLRAFDTHASDDPTLLVSLSPSEKACALSHIATWKGIASSSFANSFTYSGFARGDPIHEPMGKIGVDHMGPCPVALVLEDDAVLVDRFQDRLDQLLEELPRDFHYCALGYAKPKEAPLLDIPGCQQIKLPTMTWYLTGYLLSQSGAQYLLDHLPVVGPIDAWMGLKMILTSNWENEFGHRVGVGDAPQKGADYVRPTLSLKEIRMCVKFRAYCAGVPLCDQKVRTATATGASASHHDAPIQNWRLRDSDIVYSGSIGTTNRKRRKSYRYGN